MGAHRFAWTEPPGFAERTSRAFAALDALQDGEVAVFTHARRAERHVSRTSETLRCLVPYGFRDVPLWDAEDVPHDSRGRALVKHVVRERQCMWKLFDPYVDKVLCLIEEGRCVVSGSAAAFFFRGSPHLHRMMVTGELPVIFYPCEWIRSVDGVFEVLQRAAECAGRSFMGEQLFLASVYEAASRVASSHCKEAWAAKTDEEMAEILAKQRATWATKSDEELAEIVAKQRATWAAKPDEERAAIRSKRARTWEQKTPQELAAIEAKRQDTLGQRTPEQRRAIWHKILRSRCPAAWLAKLRLSRMNETPEAKALRTAKMKATRAAKTSEERRLWQQRIVASRMRQRERWVANITAAHARKSPEQKRAEHERRMARLAARTPEQRALKIQRIHAAIARRTEEAKAEMIKKSRATRAAKTEDEKRAIVEKYKATIASKTAEERAVKGAKISASRKARTPEELEAVREKMRKTVALRMKSEAEQELVKFRAGELSQQRLVRIVKNGDNRKLYRKKHPGTEVCDAQERLCEEVRSFLYGSSGSKGDASQRTSESSSSS